VEPGRDRPLPQPPIQTPFDFTIEQPGRSQVPRAVEELHFVLEDIHIEGAKSIPPAELKPLYARLIGRQVTVNNILDVADAIEDRYRGAGYVISRAFVPPQRVRNGIFTIRVVEGYVSDLTIDGGDAKTQALIRAYFKPVLGERPLTLATMERALLLANDLSGVAASGVLRPSPNVQGASELVVTLVQSPVTGGFGVDNRGSQFQGIWTLGADIAANGLFSAGDQLSASYATSPNVLEKVTGQVRYRRPIGADGLIASASVTVTHGEPGASLTPLMVITDSYAVGPRLSYPILRSRAETLQIDGGITVQGAKVTTLGLPLNHDQWRVADIDANYSRALLGGAAGASLDLAQGLGILGATTSGSISTIGLPILSQSGASRGNPEFTKIGGTIRFARTIVDPLSFAFIAQGQYGFAPLVAGEQIAFGSAPIGRGYDPGAITGDHGVGGAFELRYDEHLPRYYVELLQPYVFYDTAKVWNRHGASAGLAITAAGTVGTGSGLALSSTGLGVRLYLPRNITADFEFAHTMKAVPGSDNGRRTNKFLVEAGVRF
jgi:hemolysin activation/secretion protein